MIDVSQAEHGLPEMVCRRVRRLDVPSQERVPALTFPIETAPPLHRRVPDVRRFQPEALALPGVGRQSNVAPGRIHLAPIHGMTRGAFILPAEGAHQFIDNLCIPKSAAHKREAMLFMNYCLRPEVSKLISDEFPYTNPNLAARKLLSKEQLDNPASYPPTPPAGLEIGAESPEEIALSIMAVIGAVRLALYPFEC